MIEADERFAQGECYLTIQAQQVRYGPRERYELRIDRVTQRKPALNADEVALKIAVTLPVALFLKPTLSASISVDGDVPKLELDAETQSAIEDLIRSSIGLDVELKVIAPEGDE